MLFALMTSIWNHSSTSELAKWSDRITMGCGTIIIYTIAPVEAIYYTMPVIIGTYGLAKKMNNSILHIVTHIGITYINIYILAYVI